jgi:threonine dehydrogenase-like Zn-dependent dehydrogenase
VRRRQQSLDLGYLALISQGKIDRKPLITHKYAQAEAVDAFEAQLKTSETLKAIIKP